MFIKKTFADGVSHEIATLDGEFTILIRTVHRRQILIFNWNRFA